MLRLRPITFRARVILYFALQGLLLLTLIAIAVLGLEVTVGALDDASSEMVEELQPVHDLQFSLASVDQVVMAALVDGDPADRETYRRLARDIDHRLEFLMSDASPFDSSDEQKVVHGVFATWQEARRSVEPLLDSGAEALQPQHVAGMKQLIANINYSISRLNTIYDIALSEIQQAQHHAVVAKSHSMRLVLVILIIGLAAMTLALVTVGRTVLRPVRLLVDASSKLGQGNLQTRVPLEGDDEIGQLAHAFNTMASELARQQEALVKLATHDGLTGLYNHAEFMKRLASEVARTRRYHHPLSLLMLDIDCFKAINDRYGHVIGDRVLANIASVLEKQMRPSDLCARYGGEEFTVILPETDVDSAATMAERIRAAVEADGIDDDTGKRIAVTISIGVAGFRAGEGVISNFVEAADTALYNAKRQGRNRVVLADSASASA